MLALQSIPHSAEVNSAGHLLFETKPYSARVLSEQPYVKIVVESENFTKANQLLEPLMQQKDFLFIVEGPLLDEILAIPLL